MASKIPTTNVVFKDTRNSGGITIEGYELTVDDKGCIEAPIRLEDQLRSHGFLRIGAPEYFAWLKTQPDQKKVK